MNIKSVNPWTLPFDNSTAHAHIWHARKHAKWLLSAGAEARLSLLMISGSRSYSHWQQLLTEQGVILQTCEITNQRPIPSVLLQHRGDHFNRTLFVLDGLDQLCVDESQQSIDLLQILNGQRKQLKQMATWVCIVVRHPSTLALIRQYASDLYTLVQKRCLMWDHFEVQTHETSTAISGVNLEQSLSNPNCIEDLFQSLSCSHLNVDDWSMSRLVRCAYAQVPSVACKEWQIYHDLWVGHVEGQRQMGGLSMTRNLPAVFHHQHALMALAHRSDALPQVLKGMIADKLNVEGRYILAYSFSEIEIQQIDSLALQQAIQLRQAMNMNILDTLDLSMYHHSLSQLSVDLRGYYALDIAQAYAMQDQIQACIDMLNFINDALAMPWEVRFVALEYLVKIYTDLHQRNKAQICLDQLWKIVDILHAPLYEVRALLVKAEFLGKLDPARAQLEEAEAQRIALIYHIAI